MDRKVEHFLADEFKKFDSSIGFRGEEFGVRSDAKTTWLVDPIDGTAHFIRGMPFCTSMVALIEDNQVIMSVIYDFIRQDMYWAIKGQGAYRNDQRLQVSGRALHQGLIAYETRLKNPEDIDAFLKTRQLTTLLTTINCGFEFAMVASGKLDGRIGKDPYGEDWDFAPGSLLVSEAGGTVCNIGLDSYNYRNHDYLAVNPVIYKELTAGKHAIFPIK